MTRDRREVERPVERAVAAADNQNALVAKLIHLAHGIMQRLALVGLDARNGRLLRLERTAAGGDDHDLALEHLALVGGDAEQRIADLFHLLDHLVEMELRIERLDLLQQRIDQPLRAGHGDARNVVNRLFRIKLGALPADLVEDVDEMRFHIEQAKLEHSKQADRAGADNDNVRFDRFDHSVSVLVFRDQPDAVIGLRVSGAHADLFESACAPDS